MLQTDAGGAVQQPPGDGELHQVRVQVIRAGPRAGQRAILGSAWQMLLATSSNAFGYNMRKVRRGPAVGSTAVNSFPTRHVVME